ncbi:hypothetical protein JCM16303_001214 [Sporobolomyces ruberrimus]
MVHDINALLGFLQKNTRGRGWICTIGKPCHGILKSPKASPAAIAHLYAHVGEGVPEEYEMVYCRYCAHSMSRDRQRTMRDHQNRVHVQTVKYGKINECTACNVTWPSSPADHENSCPHKNPNTPDRAFRVWDGMTCRYDYLHEVAIGLFCCAALSPEPTDITAQKGRVEELEADIKRYADARVQPSQDLDDKLEVAKERLELLEAGDAIRQEKLKIIQNRAEPRRTIAVDEALNESILVLDQAEFRQKLRLIVGQAREEAKKQLPAAPQPGSIRRHGLYNV